MGFQNVNIDNFRGIKNLKIPDMKQVNLLVGRNNCGKTSILEAIWLLAGMSNSNLPVAVDNLRGLVVNTNEGFTIFNNLDFSKHVELEGSVDGINRKLIIKPVYSYSDSHQKPEIGLVDSQKQDNLQGSASTSGHNVEAIDLEFRIKEKTYHSKVKISMVSNPQVGNTPQVVPEINPQYKEDLLCGFWTPRTLIGNINDQMGKLIVNKKLDIVISVLKNIEPKLSDIRMANNLFFVDIGVLNKLLPINVMGEGMRSILAIIADIVSYPNGVVLIDEIENGLHYSSLSSLWRAILITCKENNTQLIATTHSPECVKALSDAYDKIKLHNEDEIRLYRIDRSEGKHKAFEYNPEVLKAGIEKQFEVL
jgi:predicted ATPase